MSLFKPIDQDCRGYTDRFICKECQAIIQLSYCDNTLDYNYCPYCGKEDNENIEV